jgi:hypothetical protein
MGIFVLWQTINSDDNKFSLVVLKVLLVFHFLKCWRVLEANVEIMSFFHFGLDIDGYFETFLDRSQFSLKYLMEMEL